MYQKKYSDANMSGTVGLCDMEAGGGPPSDPAVGGEGDGEAELNGNSLEEKASEDELYMNDMKDRLRLCTNDLMDKSGYDNWVKESAADAAFRLFEASLSGIPRTLNDKKSMSLSFRTVRDVLKPGVDYNSPIAKKKSPINPSDSQAREEISITYPLNNPNNIANLALTLRSAYHDRMPSSWSDSHVTTLLYWYAHSLNLKERHYHHASLFFILDKLLNTPSIVLSLAASIMVAFVSDCGNGQLMHAMQVCISLSTAFVALDSLLDLGDRKQQHLHSARNFSTLAEEIRTELMLNRDRKRDISTLLGHVSHTFNAMYNVAPLLLFGRTSSPRGAAAKLYFDPG